MKVKRKSNIELLRIVLMLMIISHHIIVHGLKLKNVTSSDYHVNMLTYIEFCLNSFFVIGVNVFVFIAGYFGIKFNLKRIIYIIIQAISYSVFFYFLFCLTHKINFDFLSFLKSFFPISQNYWWFITTYIGLCFIAPFLNNGIDSFKKHELYKLLLGLFLLNCFSSFVFAGISYDGYNLFNFIFIYLIGRFFHQIDFKMKFPGLILLLCTTIISVLCIVFVKNNKLITAWHLFYYNNPILILSAMSLFFLFYKFEIKYNTFINKVAQFILGVYMIHDYLIVRNHISMVVNVLVNNFSKNLVLLFFLIIGLIFFIFILSSLIESIRMYLFNVVLTKIEVSNFGKKNHLKLKVLVLNTFSKIKNSLDKIEK